MEDELNKSLFKAITQNVKDDIHSLINSGADANSEFTIDELVNNELLDNYAINVIENSKTSVDSVLSGNMVTDENTISIIKNYNEVIVLRPTLSKEIVLRTDSKLSTLQLAILYGWKEVIIALINEGSNPNKALDIQRITILQLTYASTVFQGLESYLFDEDIIKLLFDYGADPNVQDANGKTFLHYAMASVQFLITVMKSDFNIQTDSDDFNVIRRIETYLVNGCNPNIGANYSCCKAICNFILRDEDLNRREWMINLLLDHGGVRHEDVTKNTRIVRMLRENCGISNIPNVERFTSAYLQRVEKQTQLINAIKSQELSKISILLNENISSNVRDNDGFSALHLAVKHGGYDIVDLLLKKGAISNIKCWNTGTTPLFNAVINSRTDIGELLLKHEANPNIKNTKGLTPLYFSVTNNDGEMTELLLKYNANPDVSSQIKPLLNVVVKAKNDSDIPLVESALEKVKSLAKFLKSKGVIIKYTLFHQAMNIAEKNNQKVAKRIQELLDELEVESGI